MHPTAQRVVDAARLRGVSLDVQEFPDGTRTAEDAARAVGVEVGQIVKSLVFEVDGTTVLALVSGTNRLDETALRDAAGPGAAVVRRLDADTVRAATGFAIGGVPPFGHPTPLRTFIDRDLLQFDIVWAAAGTPRHVFPMTPDDLVRLTAASVAGLRVTQ
jgi:prolyl-tRNA editing enzyme YbaK/EbsC (Cys-tRNA(Pro) deacylase)